MSAVFLGLPVLSWELKEFQEKDEKFNLVFDDDGKPVISDSWVIISLLTPSGAELHVEVDSKPFAQYILPKIFSPTMQFWKHLEAGDPLYAKKEEVVKRLTAQKDKLLSLRSE